MLIPLLFAVYGLFSLWSLAWYPIVHSDEVWLASLSRTMLRDGDVAATEDFFGLTRRFPHAVKILYHLIQIPFVALNYGHIAARLPSLIAGFGAVLVLYRIVCTVTGSKAIAAMTAVAFGLDPQVLYISHFGRQEALIMVIILGGLAVLILPARDPLKGDSVNRSLFLAGLIVASGVFVHPNAFLAMAVLMPWVLRKASSTGHLSTRRHALSGILIFIAAPATAAVIAVALSVAMDPHFFPNYLAFGRSVGVSDNYLRRYFRLLAFFRNLSGQNQGTYYLPPITTRFVTGVCVSAIGTAIAVSRILGKMIGRSYHQSESLQTLYMSVLSMAACILGFYTIGKYSPPSIVFIFPFIYLSVAALAGFINDVRPRGESVFSMAPLLIMVITIALPSYALVRELPRWYQANDDRQSYSSFADNIREVISTHDLESTRILANLNTGFALAPDQLRAFHDLAAIPAGETGAMHRYIRDENIGAVFLPREELDFIYQNRPVWNDVYGNPTRFYPQLLAILEQRGTLVETIYAPYYGMRLLRYLPLSTATIEVYLLRDGVLTR